MLKFEGNVTLRRRTSVPLAGRKRETMTTARMTNEKVGRASPASTAQRPPFLPPPLYWLGRVEQSPEQAEVEYSSGHWDYVGEF